MNKQLENYYHLIGLTRDKEGPGEHKLDDGTIVK
jgi:hypothetical protein